MVEDQGGTLCVCKRTLNSRPELSKCPYSTARSETFDPAPKAGSSVICYCSFSCHSAFGNSPELGHNPGPVLDDVSIEAACHAFMHRKGKPSRMGRRPGEQDLRSLDRVVRFDCSHVVAVND